MRRLQARVFEVLEESVQKVGGSLFSENGKLGVEFIRLKKSMIKVVKKEHVDMHEFAALILGFSRAKYRKQIFKLETYLQKLEEGSCISLRDLYAHKDRSDVSSPDEKPSKPKPSTSKKPKKLANDSSSPNKRASVKKVANPELRPKRMKHSKRDESVGSDKVKEAPGKKATAVKLLKYYAMLELKKPEFLEDYAYEREPEEQKKQLLSSLLEKNKANGEQIKAFTRKCEGFSSQRHLVPNESSDDNHSACIPASESMRSRKNSAQKSFVIHPRKPSYTFDPTDRSDVEWSKQELPPSKTIKNLPNGKRPAQSNTPRKRTQSKRLLVQKQPVMFEEELIPKASLTRNEWMPAPLTNKDKLRKNEQLRLKKRNNPCPIESHCLPESFDFKRYH